VLQSVCNVNAFICYKYNRIKKVINLQNTPRQVMLRLIQASIDYFAIIIGIEPTLTIMIK